MEISCNDVNADSYIIDSYWDNIGFLLRWCEIGRCFVKWCKCEHEIINKVCTGFSVLHVTHSYWWIMSKQIWGPLVLDSQLIQKKPLVPPCLCCLENLSVFPSFLLSFFPSFLLSWRVHGFKYDCGDHTDLFELCLKFQTLTFIHVFSIK